MSQRGFRTAKRRYHYLFWPLMGVYTVLVFATSFLVDTNTAPPWLKITSALAVTLPLFGVLYAMRRQTEETDEYTRMRQLQAMRDGGLITAACAFLVGFLQIFEVLDFISVFWFGPLFFISYGLSFCTQNFGKVV